MTLGSPTRKPETTSNSAAETTTVWPDEGFTEEEVCAFDQNNEVWVEIESRWAIYRFELNRACSAKQLVQSLRLFAAQIEATLND